MYKKLLIPLLFAGALVFLVSTFDGTLAYDDKTTHPALTDEIVDFYNLLHSDTLLTPEQKEWVVEGAIAEDTPPRWINHFYDPIHNTGWTGEHTGWLWEGLMQNISYWILAQYEPVSSLNWLRNRTLQTSFALYQGDRTWDRALEEYKKGNKKEAYRTLGHILHLIEDASVPDHTRNDTHAHELQWATGDYGSPYEEYLKKYNRQTIKQLHIAETLKQENKQPPQQQSVDDYLISLAKYSNKYFFSKDTVNNSEYKYPDVDTIKNNCDESFCYGFDEESINFPLVRIEITRNNKNEFQKSYLLEESNPVYYPILDAYFSRLSRQAVLHGAGVIELFHKQASNSAVQVGSAFWIVPPPVVSITGELYRAWDLLSAAQIAVNVVHQTAKSAIQATANVVQTAAITVQNTAKQVVSATASFFSSALSVPLSFLTASVGNIAPPEVPYSNLEAGLPSGQIVSPPAQIAPVIVSAPIAVSAPVSPIVITPAPVTTPSAPIFNTSPIIATNSAPPQTISTTTAFKIIPPGNVLSARASSSSEIIVAVSQGSGSITGVSPEDLAATERAHQAAEELAAPQNSIASFTESAASPTLDIATSTDPIATPTDSIDTSTASTTEDIPPEPEPEIVYADPVVINEIAWMGTTASYNDEWIELYNKTNNNIDLAGWTLESKNKSLNIRLTGTIKANSYFLLERTASTTTDQPEDMIFTGAINNSGPEASLYLKNGSTTIDYIDFGYWPAGDNASKKTMERVSPYAEGNNFYNWKTYSPADAPLFARDAGGNDILGTPKAKNSATGWYVPADLLIIKDTIWRKGHGPYFVPSVITIATSSTLTIEPGVVVKFAKGAPYYYGGGMNVEGVLRAEGTRQRPIIFTSSADDAADGIDIDRNGTSTVPAPADWMNINFINPTRPSSFKYVQVRYGGQGTNHNPNGWYPDYTGALNIQNSSPEIYNSVFASNTAAALYVKGNSYPKIIQSNIGDTAIPSGYWSSYGGAGVRLVDASSTADIIGNDFENNTVAIVSRSASSMPLVVRDNIFRGNKKNAEFYSGDGLNLDNSGNRDLDSKGGFHIAFSVARGKSVLLKADAMPYIFEGGEFITVDEGGALAIEPGTVLKNKDVVHTIRGTLTARGTADKPIIFTALADDADGYDSNFATSTPQDGAWKNIQFIGASSSDSVLENVEIKYGGQGTNYNPNGWYPTYTGSIGIQDSSPKISNVRVENSQEVSIHIKGNSYPTIKNSVIKNTITPAYYFGVPTYNTGLYIADAISSAEIIGNLFENNDAAIRSISASDAPLVIKDNVFSGNNMNGSFSGYPNFNLDNSGNRDKNNKGGFQTSLDITNGQHKTLKADLMPYMISYALVSAGGTLVIEPGTVIKIGNSSVNSLQIYGTLIARGTKEEPIVFTALADDSDGYDSNLSDVLPKEGDWKNIQFIGASSSDSILENVIVKYGGSGVNTCPYAYFGGPCMAYEGAVLINSSSLIINSSMLDRSLAIALYVKGTARPIISNSSFIDTKMALATPSTTIGGFGLSIGAESLPTLDNDTYSGNAQDVVYR